MMPLNLNNAWAVLAARKADDAHLRRTQPVCDVGPQEDFRAACMSNRRDGRMWNVMVLT